MAWVTPSVRQTALSIPPEHRVMQQSAASSHEDFQGRRTLPVYRHSPSEHELSQAVSIGYLVDRHLK